MKYFSHLDVFDKFANDDFKEHTSIGIHLSTTFSTLTITIFSIFLFRAIRPKVFRDLSLEPRVIDDTQLINVSLTVLVNMPCSYLRLNSFDSYGFNRGSLNTTATFRRVSPSRKIIGVYEQPPPGYIDLTLIRNINPGEKCIVQGKIIIKRVPGTFYISSGAQTDILSVLGILFQQTKYDLSHHITRLRFGPKVSYTKSRLEHVYNSQLAGIPQMSIYNLIVTPVIYMKNNKKIEEGYEYHVARSSLYLTNGFSNPPGIYFSYSFTPYAIMINAHSGNVLLFLTSAFGVIAGIFAILSFTDLIFDQKDFTEPQNTNTNPNSNTNTETNNNTVPK